MKIIKRPVVLAAEEKAEWLEQIRRLGDPEKVFFMDIETTGFNRTYDSVYLTGFLYFEAGQFYLEQHLASDLRDEPEIVEAFCDRLSDAEQVITFNGEMFDFPFMENRHRTLHVTAPWPTYGSCDLLRRYRPYQTLFGWENCRLKTMERSLGVDREDVFTGGELIEVFETYALKQDPELEKVLLLHNYEDILNIPRLLRIDQFISVLHQTPVEQVQVLEFLVSSLLDQQGFHSCQMCSYQWNRTCPMTENTRKHCISRQRPSARWSSWNCRCTISCCTIICRIRTSISICRNRIPSSTSPWRTPSAL